MIRTLVLTCIVFAWLIVAGIANAQTSTSTTDMDAVNTTVNAPNTGAGGERMQNLILLGATGLVTVAGLAYLTAHRHKKSR